MNLEEYEKIKDYDYDEYCNYLHQKYGIPQGAYFLTPTCKSKNQKITRGNEGLFLHHIMECKTDLLCDKEKATRFPFEWQEGKNLVYCDLLEHLLLHIMIYEETFATNCRQTGIGGVINWIVPELNDVYSGFISEQQWRKIAHNKIKNELDLYLELVKRFYICDFVCYYYINNTELSHKKIKQYQKEYNDNYFKILFSSFNSDYGLWEKEKNWFIFDKINEIKSTKIDEFDIQKVINKDILTTDCYCGCEYDEDDSFAKTIIIEI